MPVAVAATGTAHLLNRIFKGGLLVRQADWRTVARFGLPAIPAAVLEAWLLVQLSETPRLFAWGSIRSHLQPDRGGVTIGALMIVFALPELQPWFQRLAAPARLLLLGGVLTRFIGGLTGQLGAPGDAPHQVRT